MRLFLSLAFAAALTTPVSAELINPEAHKQRLVQNTDHIDPSTVAIVHKGRLSICSGTTIGTRYVITAAHCLYNSRNMTPRTELSVIPGLHLAKHYKPSSRFHLDKAFVVRDYITKRTNNGSSRGADIAVLKLREFVGNTRYENISPPVPLTATTADALAGEEVAIHSYIGHKDFKTSSQYHQDGCVILGSDRSGQRVQHKCDTYKGSSGSGVRHNGELVAIHTGSLNGTYDVQNRAAVINESIAQDIRHIINGQEERATLFTQMSLKAPPFVGIDIRNDCRQTIWVAFHYTDLAGQPTTKGFYRVEPGRLAVLSLKLKSNKFKFYALSKDRKFIWAGPDQYMVRGKSYGFRDYEVKDSWHDALMRFECR